MFVLFLNKWSILIVLFSMICFGFGDLTNVRYCDSGIVQSNPDLAKRIEKSLAFGEQACYFQVKDMKNKSIEVTSRYRKLSIEKARNVCKEFSTTLPTIHSEEENNFVKAIGTNLLLGVEIRLPNKKHEYDEEHFESTKPDIQKWDDAVQSDFRPISWTYPSGDPAEIYTFVRPNTGDWQTQNTGKAPRKSFDNLLILCKQNLTNKKIPSNAFAADGAAKSAAKPIATMSIYAKLVTVGVTAMMLMWM